MNHWWEYGLSILGGGFLVKLLDFFRSKKKDKINEFKELLDRYKIDYTTVKADYEKVRVDYEKVRAELDEYKIKVNVEIVQLRNQVELLESAHQDLPLPMWLKDSNGTMLALNPEYEHIFLIPRGKTKDDYIGNTDFDVWPEATARQFDAHDKLVYKSGKKFDGFEEVPDMDGNNTKWRIIKYVRYSGRTKVGIAGIAFPVI